MVYPANADRPLPLRLTGLPRPGTGLLMPSVAR